MSKNKTTSKVPLKLNSRINLEWQGAPARRAPDFGHSPQAPPQPGKGHSQTKEDPQLPQKPLITPPGLQERPQMAIIDYV